MTLKNPDHPGLTVIVTLRDAAGSAIEIVACGATVDDAVAWAEREADRLGYSDHGYDDWRPA